MLTLIPLRQVRQMPAYYLVTYSIMENTWWICKILAYCLATHNGEFTKNKQVHTYSITVNSPNGSMLPSHTLFWVFIGENSPETQAGSPTHSITANSPTLYYWEFTRNQAGLPTHTPLWRIHQIPRFCPATYVIEENSPSRFSHTLLLRMGQH